MILEKLPKYLTLKTKVLCTHSEYLSNRTQYRQPEVQGPYSINKEKMIGYNLGDSYYSQSKEFTVG